MTNDKSQMANLKSYIQLFVPPIYYKVKKRLFPKKEPQIYPLPKIKPLGDKVIVIGNGPSLNKTMELYGDIVRNTPCVMVNFSANTPMFEDIKPKYYLMADPGFLEDNYVVEAKRALIKALCDKTDWPMTIIMPDFLRAWEGSKELHQNSNITLLFYNNRWKAVPNEKLFEAWDNNETDPPGQTILNTALWLSIYIGYKETYLIGADTSFIQDIYVGQKDNVLYTLDRHFYNNEDVCPEDVEPEKHGRPFGMTMEQLLNAVHIMFQSYNKLRGYAEWKSVKIYNASEYSMIDCFERKRLNE